MSSAFYHGIVGALSIILMYGFYYAWKGLVSVIKNRGSRKRKADSESFQIQEDLPQEASLYDVFVIKSEYIKFVYSEMLEECNPKRFMNPYDYDRIKVANEVFSYLLSSPNMDETQLINLRHRAIEELGIVFNSEPLYKFLASACSPARFMEPYNAEKVNIANELYAKIENHKRDIEQLEKIRDEAQELGIISSFQEVQNKDIEPGNLNSPEADSRVKFREGQLVIVLDDESQFRVALIKVIDGKALYYSAKLDRWFASDEIEDYEIYWQNKCVEKSGSKKSASPLKRTSSENDLTNKPKEANTLDNLTESLSNDNSTQVLVQKGNNEQQEGCQSETLSVGLINPDTSSKYKLGQLVIVLSNEKQFKIDSIEQINGVYWYYSEKLKRLYSESEIADSVQYWNSHK